MSTLYREHYRTGRFAQPGGRSVSKQYFAGRLTLPPILKVWFIKHQIETNRAKFTNYSQGNQALTIGGFLDLPAISVVPPTSS